MDKVKVLGTLQAIHSIYVINHNHANLPIPAHFIVAFELEYSTTNERVEWYEHKILKIPLSSKFI